VALSRRTGRSRFTLLLLVLTSVTVLTLDFRGSGVVDDLRGGASTVFSPVRDGAEKIFDPVGDAWHGITDYGDVKADNERLRERIEELEGDAVEGREAQRQLEEIEASSGLPVSSQIPTVLARVVSGPVSNFEHTVDINRGSDAGIKTGMPVVTGAGLVGTVVQVTRTRAVVELLTAPTFEVGIRLVTSGDVGVARGSGEGDPLVVDEGIDPKVEVPDDEPVSTSGIDRSIFPADVPVGRVVEAELASNQLTQVLRIEPFADLDNLGYVRVLLWEPAP
jgi:rod shape-determining protein MreC